MTLQYLSIIVVVTFAALLVAGCTLFKPRCRVSRLRNPGHAGHDSGLKADSSPG
jgi:hypothetical protein